MDWGLSKSIWNFKTCINKSSNLEISWHESWICFVNWCKWICNIKYFRTKRSGWLGVCCLLWMSCFRERLKEILYLWKRMFRIDGIKTYKHYLFNRQFIIYTNNNALKWQYTKMNSVMEQWREICKTVYRNSGFKLWYHS